jgi:VIT1/CCC1 family predicted Fe2+/Mn2+ transporter
MKVFWLVALLVCALLILAAYLFRYTRQTQASTRTTVIVSLLLGSIVGAIVCLLSGENIWSKLP